MAHKDPEQARAYHQQYYQRNRDKWRTEKAREASRAWKARNPKPPAERYAAEMRRRHGLLPDELARLWQEQGGRCYLGGENLADLKPHQIHVDHDHSHCPPKRSCPTCRRGLACHHCNTAIGLASDDPGRLRLLADALEAAQRGVEERKAQMSTQLSLVEGIA